MKPKRRPIDHVTPRLGGERVARMWAAIEAAQERPPFAAWPVAVALVAAGLLGWGLWPASVAPLASGDTVISPRRPSALSLPDGSELRTTEATELRVLRAEPDEVELLLDRGTLHCDVSHRQRRRFAVQVGDITVLVRGTKFTVETLDSGLRVQVERGLVEVRSRGVVLASLSAGQSWTQQTRVEEALEEPAAPEPAAAEPAASQPIEPEREPAHGKRRAKHTKVEAPTQSAEQLLERANDARLAGDPAGAADLYQQLRERYPDDARAGLSAFELARISLHALHDPARALAAIRFARAHGHGFARDDADALEVEALAQANDAGCPAARARFLREHARSAHRARVEHACPD